MRESLSPPRAADEDGWTIVSSGERYGSQGAFDAACDAYCPEEKKAVVKGNDKQYINCGGLDRDMEKNGP